MWTKKSTNGFLLVLLAWLAITTMAWTGLARGAGDLDKIEQVLNSFPVHKSDMGEEPSIRATRLHYIARAVGSIENKHEQAWLMMTAKRESNLAAYVDEDHDKCRLGLNGHCDGGLAWSIWQLHGTDRTGTREQAAQLAIETFRKNANYCKARGFDYYLGGTSLYATGKTCDWPEALDRIVEMKDILNKMAY